MSYVENEFGPILISFLIYENPDKTLTISRNLKENEMIITFLNNSSIEIQGGNDHKFIIDPWLIGPSFGRSRWLYYQKIHQIFSIDLQMLMLFLFQNLLQIILIYDV
jgi:hypothetical protein